VRELRRGLEEQWERSRQAKRAGKELRAKRRLAACKREKRARKAAEERRNWAAKNSEQRAEEGREERARKHRGKTEKKTTQAGGSAGEQTPAGRTRDRVRTRSTSRSTAEVPEEAEDVSIILASERGLPAEGEIFAHFTAGNDTNHGSRMGYRGHTGGSGFGALH